VSLFFVILIYVCVASTVADVICSDINIVVDYTFLFVTPDGVTHQFN